MCGCNGEEKEGKKRRKRVGLKGTEEVDEEVGYRSGRKLYFQQHRKQLKGLKKRIIKNAHYSVAMKIKRRQGR